MRVTHVITRLIVGGAQENTIASVLGLRQIPGMEVRLISGPDTGPEGSLAGMFNSYSTPEPHDTKSSPSPPLGERAGVRGPSADGGASVPASRSDEERAPVRAPVPGENSPNPVSHTEPQNLPTLGARSIALRDPSPPKQQDADGGASVLASQSDEERVPMRVPVRGEGAAPSFPGPKVLTILPELVRPVHPWKDWLALRRLTEIFRADRPDIVHTHSGKAGVLGRLAAHRAGVPVIIHTIHGPSFGAFQGALANTVFLAAEHRAGKVTTHFVAVADAMIRQYLAAGIGSPAQYSRILSGFPLEPFLSATNDPALRARYGIAPTNFVVGKIARLFKLKGHDDLFRVAPALIRACPQIKFLLVGGGEWRERFELLARKMGLEKHFVFTGLVPPQEVPALVGIMDTLVHLSLREGLARALPQALAAGRPVVAYDCDGAAEAVREDVTGFLLRPGDLAGLEERLTRLSKDAALRERLGCAGREFAVQNFAVEKMVSDLFALYSKLAPAGRMAAP